jgi:hypothetical protein
MTNKLKSILFGVLYTVSGIVATVCEQHGNYILSVIATSVSIIMLAGLLYIMLFSDGNW